jgi:hypothetical protein
MSYTYLLEQGEESLAASYSDIPLSVLSKLNLTQEKCCSKDSETASCQSSPSGMMSAPSTEYPGGIQSTLFAEDFHAKTLVQAEAEWELKVNALDCGRNMRESLARFGLSLSLPKTAPCCVTVDSTSSYKTLPAWGMMRDGACLEVGTLAAQQEESDFGYLPAVLASDNKDRGDFTKGYVQRRLTIGKQIGLSHYFKGAPCPMCVERVMGWPMGWTGLEPLEMGRMQEWRHSHGELYHNERP